MLAVPRATEAAGDFIPFDPPIPRPSSIPHRELARCRVLIATAPLPPRASSLHFVPVAPFLAVLPSAFGHGPPLLSVVRQGSAARPRKLRVLASTWTETALPIPLLCRMRAASSSALGLRFDWAAARSSRD